MYVYCQMLLIIMVLEFLNNVESCKRKIYFNIQIMGLEINMCVVKLLYYMNIKNFGYKYQNCLFKRLDIYIKNYF